MARDNKLTKSAGEHYVCAQLARHGWAASLTRDGLERTDVLAVETGTRQMIEVQVKTALPNPSWRVGVKGILPALTHHEWYAMVFLDEAVNSPRCWLLPRDHLAAAAWLTHMSWLHDPSVGPGTRNVGIEAARVGPWDFDAYENRWDLLSLSTEEVPVMLPVRLRDAVESEGLPERHPWREGLPDWPDPALAR